jgi:hypothetical protein
MDNIILKNLNPIEHLVTPITPYFICNHFISTEIHNTTYKYININLELKANDLLKNKNYNDIKNNEIIQIQVDFFDFFYDIVLPIITKNNIKVIIITSQWYLPQIQRNHKTDNLLNNTNILLWISQNPIYTNNEKYMAFPYGICHTKIIDYVNFIKLNNINNNKNVKILNQYSSPHIHLPNNHIRKMYNIFGINSGAPMSYIDFLKNILNAEFVISTTGDRDDCFRHYECIGLNSIPVSNINNIYKDIFEENMIYSNAEEMINMINSNSVNYNYKKPNRDILTISYWIDKIYQKINLLKNNSKINLITSFYIINKDDEKSNERNNELLECLKQNLGCEYISKIHLYVDDIKSLNKAIELNIENKLNIINVGKQPLYSEMFEYCIDNLSDEICMISNSDIYLHKCDMNVLNKLGNNIFALSRHESNFKFELYGCGSHDAFIFYPKYINKNILKNIKHYQNIAGSDDNIINNLVDNGYKLYNPCFEIIIIHLHNSNVRTYDEKKIAHGKYFIKQQYLLEQNYIDSFYTYFHGLDYDGSDILLKHNITIEELKYTCNNNEEICAFNTLGFIKNNVDIKNLKETAWINKNTSHGIYVKNKYIK